MPASNGVTRCARSNGTRRRTTGPIARQPISTAPATLFVRAARSALDRAGLAARDVDVIVTVSSTGVATPSLEARMAADMGFRPSAARVPVFGLGCAGGVSGLALGARLARAEPGEVVLVVVVEFARWRFATTAAPRPT